MSKLISKKEIFKIIAKSLSVSEKKIDEKVSSNNFEEWDSMSHLSILISLDNKLSGKVQKIQELSDSKCLLENSMCSVLLFWKLSQDSIYNFVDLDVSK